MIDHVMVSVRDYARSKAFYRAVLAPLGYELVKEFGNVGGFGPAGKPHFWIGQEGTPTPPMHFAFTSPDRAAVGAFHAAALIAGATDNGGPGLRTQYHPNYFGAFAIDPDGHNIEAVCHLPE